MLGEWTAECLTRTESCFQWLHAKGKGQNGILTLGRRRTVGDNTGVLPQIPLFPTI
jgi:hypothetical protein